ncbi:MAG: sulfotransferase [Nitrospinae bacterium]|nr:sulfotransferase [Nitrospinota bacterium]
MNTKKPNFFIVGAPKCGTTALNDYLKQHPNIFIPHKKELHYFGTDLDFKYKHFSRNRAQYLANFSLAKDEKMLGEASVWYLFSKLAAKEIKDFNPSSKIIVMLRNPVDMLYSQHSQFFFDGNEDIINFEEALEAEEERKKGNKIPKTVGLIEGLFYRETIRYAEQVKRYFELFGRENVHIIIFDDFRNDTAAVYKKTLDFLGVDNSFKAELKVINKYKKIKDVGLHNTLLNLPTIPRKIAQAVIPSKIRRNWLNSVKENNTVYGKPDPMSPDLRKKLMHEFKEEVEKLSGILDRDLSGWSDVKGKE